jgi:methylmalonyl-CoA mutase
MSELGRPALQGKELHSPVHPVRFVTAAALFDGHDAAINIMRRILQAQGAEVIHLGHDRSVKDVVDAAIDEDVQGIAVSSYQGGHVEYFEYLAQLLKERGAGHVRLYGGGGGVIVPAEVERLAAAGVRIFSPEDGQRLGLPGMINELIRDCDVDLAASPPDMTALLAGERPALARAITCIEAGALAEAAASWTNLPGTAAPVLGITGTGGSGKSSLTDELVRRFRADQQDKLRIAVLAVDPTRRRGGGALLGDRIRMNSLDGGHVFFRSLATRGARELPENIAGIIAACQAAGYDLVIVETPGIGQGDAGVISLADVSVYVMTPEFGAASQLEKIDMLDFADVVAVNKFERRGGADAVRDVSRQLVRNRSASKTTAFGVRPDEMPVFGTSAATFNDAGVTALYQHLAGLLRERGVAMSEGVLPRVTGRTSAEAAPVIPSARVGYLAEIAGTIRGYHEITASSASAVRKVQQVEAVLADLAGDPGDAARDAVSALLDEASRRVPPADTALIRDWPSVSARTTLARESLSGSRIPRVALPRYTDRGELLRFLREENLPGMFPFTAGVFPFKRDNEDPARMFAGEGDAFRTNRRFKLLSEGQPATRLSTAFDSVTLYGRDPAGAPDVYGKVGTSGVSIATLDDMKALYDGFDLTAPNTSVSMTINGPAPTILAFFLNTAIDQGAAQGLSAEEVLQTVRGTVQADILKEDQGQNTCIFSTDFSLRVMADVQEWFIQHQVRNFYSVSISGYHIAEAGANPISQLAFTLANAFTYVEAYLARGMKINDFAPNLSFFFSNGMDPEYTVIGRVARRIWAVAMRDRYGANERSQKLKYHIQTSGRSLHAQEMAFNDIRTTLQALCAIYDNANSLHTNAYDEAVTTPGEESVRRALAIQLIIGREWGLAMNENPLSGSFIVEELTDLVEEAVLLEFERISQRGGVLGAMETGYQRGRIQDESMLYEQRKHDGTLPVIGVNTFRAVPNSNGAAPAAIPLSRGTEEEKKSQLVRVRDFQDRNRPEAQAALAALKEAARSGGNVFEALMPAARVCSLQQITEAFFEVGGQYRRNV